MNIAELKTTVDAYRDHLESKGEHIVYTSPAGPVGMAIIDAMVSAIGTQQEQIDELKRKLG